ncbi:DUF938 domain-containing protein [Marinimicrobium alkaliphilum]|uniref:DUF938 domain-containing protein n=1 Tax=Marinimicrobium alkaliphilum TaxID=2202654 RepID=UPI000DB97E25|nr:DUF938 domain-containing protein [Marinimicrobium alkaliphilum]
MPQLPYSQACENNKHPILDVLHRAFSDRRRVLEIGAGTGQHAAHFARALPHLEWHTSDLPENHSGINAWIDAYPAPNLHRPVTLDLRTSAWPGPFDGVYSANTAHIVSWPLVQRLLALAGNGLPENGILALYGPFNYQGRHTSDSNREFDAMLRARDPESGIRDFEAVCAEAQRHKLRLDEDNALPANNRLLIFRKPVYTG